LGLLAVVRQAAIYLGFFILVHLPLGWLKTYMVLQSLEDPRRKLVNANDSQGVKVPFSK